MAVEAHVTFAGESAPSVGRERIRLLEEVGRAGSISGGARAVGLTYKAAWDAVDALNNLFGRPLVAAQAGGRRGGGAVLTADGLRVIASFHRLEGELARAFRALDPDLAGAGLTANSLMWSFLMRTSARNALRCTVVAVTGGAVNSEVSLALSAEVTLTAVITCDSVRELGLVPGREVMALIKSSFVMLAPAGQVGAISVRNRIEGTVSRREPGAVNSEITLDIGGGKTLTAIITMQSAEDLGLRVGDPAVALIDAGHIILAVD